MRPATSTRTNPYVGPRAFVYGERIYGRDREAEELLDLLIAERIVLLYSPSGAGKTSLIQAALIPALEHEEFEPLPVIRLGQASPERRANRYILSTLLSLEPRILSETALTLEQLIDMQLADYLDHRERSVHEGATVLIFDQFEEILTLDPLDQDAKREFFRQVGIALRNTERWALFSMREDYFAALDPYLRTIPTRLKSTFRLDFLTAECARRAIQEPAREQGVDFTDAAAFKLVDDLRAVAVQTPSGIEQHPGPYVEPVQLQVVCYRLWEHLAPDDYDFRPEEIEATGDVDTALAEYYEDRLRQIAEQTKVRERHIREWFDRQLITSSGIRGQVLIDPEGIRGLSMEVVLALEDIHLVRREERRGAAWLELSHDRLLKPIRANNAAWFESHSNVLQKSAAAWQRQGRPDSLCLDGQALREAERLAGAQPEEITELEREFLEICRSRRRAKHWQRISLVQAAVGLLIAALAIWAGAESYEAHRQAKLAKARGLAARAVALLDEQLDLGLLLAYRAAEMAPDVSEIASSLFAAVLHNPRLLTFLHGHSDPVSSVAFSPDGKVLASGDFTGRVILSEAETGRTIRVTPKFVRDAIRSIAFSPDGKTMAVSSKDHSIVLQDRRSGKVDILQPAEAHPDDKGIHRNVWSLGFSNDSRLLLSSDGAGRIIVWDVVARKPWFEDKLVEGEQSGDIQLPTEVRAAAISWNGETLAAGYTGADGFRHPHVEATRIQLV
jgi:conflict system STAND superfamily ATPase/WD40 domain-containing protein